MIEGHVYQPEAFVRVRTPAETAGLIALTQPQEQPMKMTSTPATTNRFGIGPDWPCYEPGPNAPKTSLMAVVHGASSGWHLLIGADQGRIKKNGNEAFWQGLIDGGILVDVHGHDLPSGPTHDDLSDEGTGVHAIGHKRGFQHALNLVERLGGWRECRDCPR